MRPSSGTDGSYFSKVLVLRQKRYSPLSTRGHREDSGPGGQPPSEREGMPIKYDGTILRKEQGYAFLRLPQFPINIFASRAESDPAEWEKIYTGARANCLLAFNRRGARGNSVILSS